MWVKWSASKHVSIFGAVEIVELPFALLLCLRNRNWSILLNMMKHVTVALFIPSLMHCLIWLYLNGILWGRSSLNQNLALCRIFRLDHLLQPHTVGLLVGHVVLLDLTHIPLNLWLALFEKTGPKQFDKGFIEKFEPPTAIGLVENAEVNRP